MNQQPQVDLKITTKVSCECGNDKFDQTFLMRKLSALMSGNGQPALVPVPIFACSKCDIALAETIPPDLKLTKG
tara:strand:+ start:2260 stop:2481 length:222 start_codon:yes stop_codon:yes gene_type:complete